MRMKFFSALITTIAIFNFPLLAHANISVTNNTSTDGTAFIGIKGCTSKAGELGILKHYTTTVVPQFILDQYCGAKCEVKAYMSRDCSGDKIATAIVEKKTGVVSIENHNVGTYVVSGGGKAITVNGGPAKKWYNFIFQL